MTRNTEMMTLALGAKLGSYEIVAGDMGEVYRARDTRLDRFVTIKIRPQHLSKRPGAVSIARRGSFLC